MAGEDLLNILRIQRRHIFGEFVTFNNGHLENWGQPACFRVAFVRGTAKSSSRKFGGIWGGWWDLQPPSALQTRKLLILDLS